MTGKEPVATPGGGGPAAANDAPSRSLTEGAVLDYLRRNPGLIADHPEVLEALAPAPRFDNGNVVDMQTLVLQHLRTENRRLRDACAVVVAAARDNRSAREQVHAAVLQILAAGSFEKLIHTVTADLPLALDADAVTICLEAGDAAIPRAYAAGLRSLPEGAVDRLIGPGRDTALASDIAGDRMLFGAAAGLVRSQALARLRIGSGAPRGLLAIGARGSDTFDRRQGAELVAFLSRALELVIRRWLNPPA